MYITRTKFQATIAKVARKGSRTASRDVEAPSSPMSQLGTTCGFQATIAKVARKGSRTMSRDVEAPSSPTSQLGTTCGIKFRATITEVTLKEVIQRQVMLKPLHLPYLN